MLRSVEQGTLVGVRCGMGMKRWSVELAVSLPAMRTVAAAPLISSRLNCPLAGDGALVSLSMATRLWVKKRLSRLDP